ncbi:MAG: ATP-dependent DNA helicase RecG, partial [Acidimicrobiales bacterium]
EDSGPCGICDNCTGETLRIDLDPAIVERAVEYLRSAERIIESRKQLPNRTKIAADRVLQFGRVLALWGDGGWGELVREGRLGGRFDDKLIDASAALIRERWMPDPFPTWVTYVPSLRNPQLVADLAQRLAAALGLPCEEVIVKVRDTEPQTTMHNSSLQYGNVRGAFEVKGSLPPGPVLLVDDLVDSRWTMTAIGWRLLEAGSGPVFPFALADSQGKAPT